MYSMQTALIESAFSATLTTPLREPSQDTSPRLSVIARSAPERADIETYITKKFAASYGAKLREFLPYFLVLRAGNGVGGVLGMRR